MHMSRQFDYISRERKALRGKTSTDLLWVLPKESYNCQPSWLDYGNKNRQSPKRRQILLKVDKKQADWAQNGV